MSQIIAIPEIDKIYVDGSFITDVIKPNDIDIILEFADFPTLNLIGLQYPHLFHHDTVKNAFNIDLWFATVQAGGIQNDLREFFQYLRPQEAIDRGVSVGTRKGLLTISLNNERERYLDFFYTVFSLARLN